jgi:2-dehydro-3-deoxyphosphogluconate aldolase / (4S)-4-hydroxy-2-oxoglutarate aldolase
MQLELIERSTKMNVPGAIPIRRSKAVRATVCQCAIVPVLRVDTWEEAICAAEGIVLGKHPILEVTLTIPNAVELIKELAGRFGKDLIVGAGTVLNAGECRGAIQAGAQFIVSPSTELQVIEVAQEHGVLCMPGALTPTEVSSAWQAGADVIKIFPADAAGGPRYIRTLKGPFPQIAFVPSGGVDMSNIGEYLAAGAIAGAIGGLIFDKKALAERRPEVIAENVRRFAGAIRIKA